MPLDYGQAVPLVTTWEQLRERGEGVTAWRCLRRDGEQTLTAALDNPTARSSTAARPPAPTRKRALSR
ncbi:hypothetical protein [Streptomyces sp. NWU339]|uniref:hypothetical protein n=1 Tax=Streptomyces sp. NWU339 TaxID=2185284 RepID=UPI0015E7F327|nr:hypothetical protein [Streptomyces sp. NWU339]